jgi:DNA repair protein RecO (recombination protein O)
MRVELHEAYIIHRRPYRETSLLLEVLSSRHGRVALVARGARRRRGKNRPPPVMEPFQELALAWSGRGAMGTLNAAEPLGGPMVLAGQRLVSGLYLNELLVRLLPRHDPSSELYAAYRTTITGLARDGVEEVLLRRFEKVLLDVLGYGPSLERDALSNDPIEPDRCYYYRMDLGATAQREEAGAVPVTGSTLLALRDGSLDGAQQLREAKRLMRYLIDAQLGGRPLASRRLLRQPPGRVES